MPANNIGCPKGKWRWGNGPCSFNSRGEAEKAGIAIEISIQEREEKRRKKRK